MNRINFALTIGLAGAAVLVALGIWQVQRLASKREVLSVIETRLTATPGALPLQIETAAHKYRPVALIGEISEGELFVLVSQKHKGAGYRVIAPFLTEDGRRILIDRGFVPVADRDVARRTGAATIVGNLHWPDDRTSATPANDLAGNIWFARDIAELAEMLGSEPVLVVVRREMPDAPGIEPLPIDTSAIPNDHLQYAATWFSLAAIWLAMTGFHIWRSTSGEGQKTR